jgi:hypothetical protein
MTGSACWVDPSSSQTVAWPFESTSRYKGESGVASDASIEEALEHRAAECMNRFVRAICEGALLKDGDRLLVQLPHVKSRVLRTKALLAAADQQGLNKLFQIPSTNSGTRMEQQVTVILIVSFQRPFNASLHLLKAPVRSWRLHKLDLTETQRADDSECKRHHPG